MKNCKRCLIFLLLFTSFNFFSQSISNRHSKQYIDGDGLSLNSGSIIVINGLQFSEPFLLLTLVSMIAPSPDWMVFINSVNLRNLGNTDWENIISFELYPYDAGTDSSTEYNSVNADIPTHIAISSLQGIPPFNNNKVATITITLQSGLAVDNYNDVENIKVHPKPTNGVIHISNIPNNNLKNIEIYNVLGRLVKLISLEEVSNNATLNLSYLKRGIYILKLNMFGIHTKILKIFVE